MVLSKINKVKLNTLEKKIEFNKDTLNFGCMEKNGGLRLSPDFYDTYCSMQSGVAPRQMYALQNGVYVLGSDKKMYMMNGGDCYLLSDLKFNLTPFVIDIKYEGNDAVLIVSNNNKIIIVDEEIINVDVPYGSCAKIFAGMLIVGYQTHLYFSESYNFSNFSEGFNLGGDIEIKDAGNVFALKELGGKLFVICEHKIFEFLPYGDSSEYRLKEIQIPMLNIYSSSISSNNDKIVFFADKRFYEFDGKSLKRKPTCLDKGSFYLYGNAISTQNYYVCRVSVENFRGQLFYCRHFDGDQEFFIANKNILCNGGYSFDSAASLNQFFLDEDLEEKDFESKTRSMDLGSLKNKRITEVSLYSSCSCVLKIEGDFGTKTFDIEEGKNVIKLTLISKNFVFGLSGNTGSLNIRNFGFKYNIEGE